MNIENTINTIFQGIGIPTCIADTQNEVAVSPRGMSNTLYSQDFIKECRNQYLNRDKDGVLPAILSFDPGILVGIVQLKDEKTFILGPVNSIEYSNENSNYASDSKVHKTMHYLRFAGLLSMVAELITGSEFRPDEIIFVSTTKNIGTQASEAMLLNNIFANREAYDFHTSTSFEISVMDSIAAGDAIELKRRLSEPMQGKVGEMSTDYLRQYKYLFVAVATMVSRAAIRGGMDEEIARSLFDAYCMQMDESNEVQDIIALAYKMAFDFCDI
jgi:hypothetical protein